MFCVVGDGDRLVDEQHRNTVVDAIRAPKARVVQALVAHQKQRPAVLWADEDAQELFVEHDRR